MPNPFPGMNPYIEHPQWWKGFHNTFVGHLAAALNQILPSGFYANIEERVYVGFPEPYYYTVTVHSSSSVPTAPRDSRTGGTTAVLSTAVDMPFVAEIRPETISETFVTVRTVYGNRELILVAEVLSPSNKQRGSEGQESYLEKRREVIHSTAHLLEIDILRRGMHMVAVPEWNVRQKVGRWDYIVCLHRAGENGRYEYWPLRLQNRLPRIALPLTAGVDEIVLDLQQVFENTYAMGAYERGINYNEPTDPFLIPDDEQWADALLREKGLRG